MTFSEYCVFRGRRGGHNMQKEIGLKVHVMITIRYTFNWMCSYLSVRQERRLHKQQHEKVGGGSS